MCLTLIIKIHLWTCIQSQSRYVFTVCSLTPPPPQTPPTPNLQPSRPCIPSIVDTGAYGACQILNKATRRTPCSPPVYLPSEHILSENRPWLWPSLCTLSMCLCRPNSPRTWQFYVCNNKNKIYYDFMLIIHYIIYNQKPDNRLQDSFAIGVALPKVKNH